MTRPSDEQIPTAGPLPEKERLEIADLRWRSGYRRVMPSLLAVVLSIITAWLGFFLPYRERLRDERFVQLVEHLNSPYVELQLQAVNDLKQFGERAYLPLRMAYKRALDPSIQGYIRNVLPKDLGLADPVERTELQEATKATVGEWIWIGNYDYNATRWIDQFSDIPYPSTVVFESLQPYKPQHLVGRQLVISRTTNVRETYPQGPLQTFAPQVAVMKAGTRIEITKVVELDHPAATIKRVWGAIKR